MRNNFTRHLEINWDEAVQEVEKLRNNFVALGTLWLMKDHFATTVENLAKDLRADASKSEKSFDEARTKLAAGLVHQAKKEEELFRHVRNRGTHQ